MSGTLTKHLLDSYKQASPRSSFLTSLFQSPERNFYKSSSVEIDVERSDEDLAIVITDLSQGPRSVSKNLYTNKRFTAPIYSLDFGINANDLLNRQLGNNPFAEPEFQAAANSLFMSNMRDCQAMIARSIELQASQILTTGQLDLQDSGGNTLYSIDYKPKAGHLITAGTAWNASADIQADLLSACAVVRNDGKLMPNQVIMGEGSYQEMINDSTMQALMDIKNITVGEILGPGETELLASGGEFRGTLKIGNYTLRIWTYGGRYKNPNGGAITQYVADDQVIVRAAEGRMDATFGAIPRLVPPESRVLPYIPDNIQMEGQAMSLSTFAYVSQNGQSLIGEVASRPLLIPTAIDTFARIDTGI